MFKFLLILASSTCTNSICGRRAELFDFRKVPIISTVSPIANEGVDEAFKEYVKLFEEVTDTKVVDIPINFGEIEEEDVIGICYIYVTLFGKEYKEIIVRKDYWETTRKSSKETLILHELGHCALEREHNEDFMKYKEEDVPKSIMYPYNIGDKKYYKPNRDHYLKELKGK